VAHFLDGHKFLPQLAQLKRIVILFTILLYIVLQVSTEFAFTFFCTVRGSIFGEGNIGGEERCGFVSKGEAAFLGACFLFRGSHHLEYFFVLEGAVHVFKLCLNFKKLIMSPYASLTLNNTAIVDKKWQCSQIVSESLIFALRSSKINLIFNIISKSDDVDRHHSSVVLPAGQGGEQIISSFHAGLARQQRGLAAARLEKIARR
jgi:hypothetical protein